MKTAYSTAAPVAESASRVSRILAPTDFSPLSTVAVDATVALVLASPGTSVTLVHVMDPTDEGKEKHQKTQQRTGLSHHINRADQMMKELRSKYSVSTHPSDVLETRIVTGAAAQAICDMARDEGFDLIVMSSHGHMGLTHQLIGSVAEQVVQQAPCPVLVAKCFTNTGGVLALRAPALHFTRMLVGYDHRTGAQHALDVACALSALEGGHITLVHALEPAPACPLCAVDAEAYAKYLRKALDGLAEVRTRKMPESHHWDLRVEVGEPWGVIVKLAKEIGSDLIVVGPHEHTRWGHSYVGSTAQWVVRQAQCPVLVVK